MPKVTAAGGPSNAKAEPGEPGYIAPAAEAPEVSAAEPEDTAVPEKAPEAPPAAPPAAPKRAKDPAPPAYGPPETA